jgi:hypothetical protein
MRRRTQTRKRKSPENNSEDSANLPSTSISATPSQPRRQQASWCEDNTNIWTSKTRVSELDRRGFKVPPSLFNIKKFLHHMYVAIANWGQTVSEIATLGEPREPVVNADVCEYTDQVHISAEMQRYNAISRGQVSLTTTAGQIRSTAALGSQSPRPQLLISHVCQLWTKLC